MRKFVLLVLSLLVLAVPASGELAGTLWPDFHRTYSGTNGPVYACCKVPGLGNFFGGDFDQVGHVPVANIFQGIDVYAGEYHGTISRPVGPGIAGTIRAMIAFNGDLVVGGAFPDRVALWNGEDWAFLPGLPSEVHALYVRDGVLYAGGYFGVRRLDGQAWLSLPGVLLDDVRAFVEYEGNLVAAGDPGDNICCWSGSTWAYLYPYAFFHWEDEVDAMTVFQGNLYVGGSLLAWPYSGDIENLAYWDGADWHGMEELGAANPAGPVHALIGTPSAGDGALLVGGDFPETSEMHANLEFWDGDRWGYLWPDLYGTDGPVLAFGGAADDALVGGEFENYGGSHVGNAIYSGFEWWRSVGYGITGEGLAGDAYCLTLHADAVVVGGSFVFAGDDQVNGVARWEGDHWEALGEGVGLVTEIHALHSFAGGLYLADYYLHGVRRWDGVAWTVLPGVFDDDTIALEDYDGRLYVGGEFSAVGGVPCAGIACRQDSLWVPVGGGIGGGSGRVVALEVHASALYAGGYFSTAGGSSAANIARWDGDSWDALAEGVDGSVDALFSDGDHLIVGGNFSSAGGAPAHSVASWDGAAWTPLGDNISGRVYDLVNEAGVLIAVGNLTLTDDPSAVDCVYWNGSTWKSAIVGGYGGRISAALVQAERLWLAGTFNDLNGEVSRRVAVFEAAPTAAADSPSGALVLRPCHPNPFNPSTTLRFSLSTAGPARLSIHDVQGRHLRLLTGGVLPAGEHALDWDGLDDAGHAMPSGVYFSRLEAEGKLRSDKLVLSR